MLAERRRRKRTLRVVAALERAHGERFANHWAWEMTPMPCGLPTTRQLDMGFALAALPTHHARCVAGEYEDLYWKYADLLTARESPAHPGGEESP